VANTLLSPTIITREALRVLHANLNFVANVNRQYDSSFANGGASPSGKIGPTLTIRKPNQYTVRTGAVISTQDQSEQTTTLTVSTQKGVDMNFTTQELTLTIDEFSARYIKPAMAVLASNIESDALLMLKDVYNLIDGDAAALSFLHFLQAKQRLDENLCPDDGDRKAVTCLTHQTKFVNAVVGQYNPQGTISQQYKKGIIARNMAGFDEIYGNSLVTRELTGTAAKTTGYSIDSTGTVTGSAITVKSGTDTFLKGDVITIATLNAVHPESKADLGYLQNFVVTSNSGASATTLNISPPIVTTGARQNVSAAIVADQAIVKVGAGASEYYTQSVVFHPDAFAFVSADLVDVSQFGAWGARQVMDGISMRIAKQYDITNDKVPCRIDVLYGYKAIRPELACRVHADG
jgi:hypothetical protein